MSQVTLSLIDRRPALMFYHKLQFTYFMLKPFGVVEWRVQM